jgi:hypothetical protein
MVMTESMKLVGVGLVLGIPTALLGARLINAMLFRVGPLSFVADCRRSIHWCDCSAGSIPSRCPPCSNRSGPRFTLGIEFRFPTSDKSLVPYRQGSG